MFRHHRNQFQIFGFVNPLLLMFFDDASTGGGAGGDAPPPSSDQSSSAAAPASSTVSDAAAQAPPPPAAVSPDPAAAPAGAQIPPAPDTAESLFAEFQRNVEGAKVTEPQQPQPAAAKDDVAQQPPPDAVATQPPANQQPPAVPPDQATAAATDLLAEFDTRAPLTPEEVKQRWPRIPTEATEYIAKAETHRAAMLAEREAVGGAPGLRIAKELVPLIRKTEITPQDADQALEVLTTRNQPLVAGMGSRIIYTAIHDANPLGVAPLDPQQIAYRTRIGLSEPKEITRGEAFANQIFAEEFGADAQGNPYTTERLKELVAFDKAGLINPEYFRDELAKAQPVSEREKLLEQRLAQVEGSLKQTEAQKKAAAEQALTTQQETADAQLSQLVMSPVLPLAKEGGWVLNDDEVGPDGKPNSPAAERKVMLGEMLALYIDKRVKASAEYKDIKNLVKQGRAFANGKPSEEYMDYAGPLVTRAIGWFRAAQRTLNPEFAKQAAASRNAQIAAKNNGNGDDNREVPPLAPKKAPTVTSSIQADLDAAWEELQGTVRDATTPVGVR